MALALGAVNLFNGALAFSPAASCSGALAFTSAASCSGTLAFSPAASHCVRPAVLRGRQLIAADTGEVQPKVVASWYDSGLRL